MVLQRGMPIPVFGLADPGEEIVVSLGGHTVRTQADEDGHWIVKLPAMKAGGAHQLEVRASNRVTINGILVGEVWICSGQSNMEWAVRLAKHAGQEIPKARYPDIRIFQVPKRPSGIPAFDVQAEWRPCSPESIGDFYAVAYYFGRELHNVLGVPIGLIQAAWGGTAISPWIPREGFASSPQWKNTLEAIEAARLGYRKAIGGSLDDLEAWSRAAEVALTKDAPIPRMPFLPLHPLESHEQPTGLYNGMIHPIVPFAIRGVIWYQGESDVGAGMKYSEKMNALIQGWRKVWGQGDFPFYYVQLAPFSYPPEDISPEDPSDPRLVFELPEIWEAQTAVLRLPNTGMVVTTDLGELKDIHPSEKREVGRRLSLWALARTYGKERLVYSGPLYRSITLEGGRIRIHFDHVGSGLTTRDGSPPTWFEVAGPDRIFTRAQASIEGDTVLAFHASVPEPSAVRFGWHQEAQPNLINEEGLPASPFRAEWKE
ncbi:MAG: sialate O-acetylesterase [Planctomycetota bacterium]|jgi:sialate O-acetylesterase